MYQNVSSKRMENQLGTMDLNDADFAFALQLQEQFNREDGFPLVADLNHLRRTNNTDHVLALQLQEELNKETAKSTFTNGTIKTSIVDKFWELNDPNPDIRGLFLEFNASYFWNKLQPVEVRWSNRMTLCAGLCCYEGRGGLCSIRLSLPLLKLRPRKDLVETLLHEMIHAYLFVTHNNRDHDAHGPEFIKHMHRINKLTGANITIYHNFHDEVNEYRQHWWRCNGPCQHRPPYYGIVRRAMNRAPSANDFWWEEHKMTCGGTYEKIKEPEENSTKRKQIETTTDGDENGDSDIYQSDSGIRKKAKNENMNIKTFFLPSDENQFGNDQFFHNRIKETSNSSGSSCTNMNSSKNIHTFSKVPKSSQIMPFSGKGYILGSSSLLNSNSAHKKGTLLSYFESNENTCDKHSSSSKETKFGNKKRPELTPLKKHIQSTMKSYASELHTTLSPDNQTPTKFHGIWPKVTNTSQYLKEKGSRKKLLPPGKLSTASPLNHVRKIFMVNDNNTDCSSENLHIKTLPDMATSKQYVKKELSINNISSLETQILNSASDKLTVTCPVCNQEIQNIHINSHLDQCLSG